jgi:hypothetical protein
VGTLLVATWLGALTNDAEVRRLDGDPMNDRLGNLAYGTREEVEEDYARRARREKAAGAPAHCAAGHRYADTWLGNWGDRYCPECRKERARVGAIGNETRSGTTTTGGAERTTSLASRP